MPLCRESLTKEMGMKPQPTWFDYFFLLAIEIILVIWLLLTNDRIDHYFVSVNKTLDSQWASIMRLYHAPPLPAGPDGALVLPNLKNPGTQGLEIK